MKIKKGTLAIDLCATGPGRLVLVKDLLSDKTYRVRSFTGVIRLVEEKFLAAIMQAPEGTKTVTEAIKSQPRKTVKKLLEYHPY